MHQHLEAIELRQRLQQADARNDEQFRRQILSQLQRIELRELSAQQLDEQARHIAQQCAG